MAQGGALQWRRTALGAAAGSGAVRGRSQFKGPNGNWAKRDAKTGRVMDQKQDGTPFKGVTKEK